MVVGVFAVFYVLKHDGVRTNAIMASVDIYDLTWCTLMELKQNHRTLLSREMRCINFFPLKSAKIKRELFPGQLYYPLCVWWRVNV